MDERRIGTNDSYYEACRKLADIAIRTERYYASAHQPCITESEIIEFEEWHWRKKNLIEKTLAFHLCEGKNYLSDLKKRRDYLVTRLLFYTDRFDAQIEIEEIDRKLLEFQKLEREEWFRDKWTRWTYRVEEFKLEFGYKPIISDWEELKQQALKFINQ